MINLHFIKLLYYLKRLFKYYFYMLDKIKNKVILNQLHKLYFSILKFFNNLKQTTVSRVDTVDFINCFDWNNINNKFIIHESVNTSQQKLTYRIIYIKNVSKVVKSGVLRRFVIKTLISNSSTNWIGLGSSKNINLLEAVENSYLNAFSNIYQINTNLLGTFNFIQSEKKYRKLKFIFSNKTNKISQNIITNSIFDILNLNTKLKILHTNNKPKTIKYFLNIINTNNHEV